MGVQLRVPFEALEQVCSIKVLEDLYQLVKASLHRDHTCVHVGESHEEIGPFWWSGSQRLCIS